MESDLEADPVKAGINTLTGTTFKIAGTKLSVPVVTLSNQNNNELLQKSKARFKRTIKWNKYRSEMNYQVKNNNLNYLIDPTFTKVNRLFVLSFKDEDDRTSFSKYYIRSIQIKDFNVLIDGKEFFDFHIKNKEEVYGKIIYMGKITTAQQEMY